MKSSQVWLNLPLAAVNSSQLWSRSRPPPAPQKALSVVYDVEDEQMNRKLRRKNCRQRIGEHNNTSTSSSSQQEDGFPAAKIRVGVWGYITGADKAQPIVSSS